VEVMFPSTTCGDAVGESEVAQLEVVAFKHKESLFLGRRRKFCSIFAAPESIVVFFSIQD
jgi:hypothetical protein